MATQSWVNMLNAGPPWQGAQGTILNTLATQTISPQAAGSYDFVLPGQPNGIQFYVGMKLRLRARGVAATGSTTANLTVWPALGVSGTLATTLCTTAALALGTGSLTPLSWTFESSINCTAVGFSGTTLTSDGLFILSSSGTVAVGTANGTIVPLPFTSTAFNVFTSATAIGLRASLSAAFGSIQCNEFIVEQVS